LATSQETFHGLAGSDQNFGHLFGSQPGVHEHELPNACPDYRCQFMWPALDGLILGQNHPAFGTSPREPHRVRRSLWEFVVVGEDLEAGLSQQPNEPVPQ
jgi:hypothetical protein